MVQLLMIITRVQHKVRLPRKHTLQKVFLNQPIRRHHRRRRRSRQQLKNQPG
jgi:hypothetical protein